MRTPTCPRWCTTDHDNPFDDNHVSRSALIRDASGVHVRIWLIAYPGTDTYVQFAGIDRDGIRRDPILELGDALTVADTIRTLAVAASACGARGNPTGLSKDWRNVVAADMVLSAPASASDDPVPRELTEDVAAVGTEDAEAHAHVVDAFLSGGSVAA